MSNYVASTHYLAKLYTSSLIRNTRTINTFFEAERKTHTIPKLQVDRHNSQLGSKYTPQRMVDNHRHIRRPRIEVLV